MSAGHENKRTETEKIVYNALGLKLAIRNAISNRDSWKIHAERGSVKDAKKWLEYWENQVKELENQK